MDLETALDMLTIEHLDSDAQWDSLAAKASRGVSLERQVLKNIFAIARTNGCNAVAIEAGYVDRDFRTSYSALYSRVYRQVENSTERMHFLKGSRKRRGQWTPQEYLGATVLRPLMVGRVGRTYLSLPDWPSSRARMSCRAVMPSHVRGVELTCEGTPFIHQDAMVMVCAQAAIWMAVHSLHLRFRVQRFFPPQITESAYRHLGWCGRPLPTAGLTALHMVNAVTNMGLSPIYQMLDDQDFPSKAARRKYILRYVIPYLESHIPVILTLPDHAVCAIGFLLADKKVNHGKEPNTISDWAQGLVIHDDAEGPYRLLLRSGDEGVPEGIGTSFLSSHNLDSVEGIIALLPERVYLSAEVIEAQVHKLIMSGGSPGLYSDGIREGREALDDGAGVEEWLQCGDPASRARFVLRTYLVDAVEYLAALRSEDFKGISPTLVRLYTNQKWPRRLWVTEITTTKRMRRVDGEIPVILGEIISDPTGNRYDQVFLAVHVPGALIDFQERFIHRLADDKPYSFGGEGSYPRLVRSF